MKTRNLLRNRFGLRFYSVRTAILVLLLSLVSTSVSAATSDDVCAATPKDAACVIDVASSYQVVVNKIRPLRPPKFSPQDLETISKFNPYGLKARKVVSEQLVAMGKAMKLAGKGTLVVQSAYRSYSTQVDVHSRQVARYGKKVGENLAARPGYSEHQTGMAIDISAEGQGCQIRTCFGTTRAGKWLKIHSYKFGFVLRYPGDKTSITGYQFEPWHFRYVGIPVATAMHKKGISTLETFFGLPRAPKYRTKPKPNRLVLWPRSALFRGVLDP